MIDILNFYIAVIYTLVGVALYGVMGEVGYRIAATVALVALAAGHALVMYLVYKGTKWFLSKTRRGNDG